LVQMITDMDETYEQPRGRYEEVKPQSTKVCFQCSVTDNPKVPDEKKKKKKKRDTYDDGSWCAMPTTS
jgi:hypothetical protein